MSVCAYQPRGARLGRRLITATLCWTGTLRLWAVLCVWMVVNGIGQQPPLVHAVCGARGGWGGGAPLGMAACWVGAWWCMLFVGCVSSVACTSRSWVLCMAICQCWPAGCGG